VIRNGRLDMIDRPSLGGLFFARCTEPVAQPLEQLTFNLMLLVFLGFARRFPTFLIT